MTSTQKTYQIENILSKKMMEYEGTQQIHYRIKWLGYNSQYNTWEPVDSLSKCCPELIAEFEKKIALREQRKKKKQEEQQVQLQKKTKTRSNKVLIERKGSLKKYDVPLRVIKSGKAFQTVYYLIEWESPQGYKILPSYVPHCFLYQHHFMMLHNHFQEQKLKYEIQQQEEE